MLTKREAKAAGKRAGYNAATWVFDGNTPDSTYARVAQILLNGDPALYDVIQEPSWLSGEHAGESLAELDLVADDEKDDWKAEEVQDIFATEAGKAFWAQVEKEIPKHIWKDVRKGERALPVRRGVDVQRNPKSRLRHRVTGAIERGEARAVAGIPVGTKCEWFAKCRNPAVTTVPHPILGDVPVCARCASFAQTGSFDKNPPKFTRQDFQLIADVIAELPPSPWKAQATMAFADRLQRTNPRFDRERFVRACAGLR